MDENYLDNLLNEISLDKEIDNSIENELDGQMKMDRDRRREENKKSPEDMFNFGLDQDVDTLSDDSELDFSEAQMEELDQLDDLADLDMGDLDFSDIDFDNLDVTKLDVPGEENLDALLQEFDDDIEVKGFQEEQAEPEEAAEDVAQSAMDAPKDIPPEQGDLNESDFDTDSFLDSLLDETESEQQDLDSIVDLGEPEEEAPVSGEEPVDEEEEPVFVNTLDSEEEGLQGFNEKGEFEAPKPAEPEEDEDDLDSFGDELDDLFSLLDLEDNEGAESGAEDAPVADAGEGEDSFSTDELLNMEEVGEEEEAPVKEKKTLMQILFGDPDEDDELSQEEIEAIEAKKEAKKAAKQAKKDAAKEKKALEGEQKKKAGDEKRKVKAEAKAVKKKAKLEARKAELAQAEPEKKLNTPAVVFIFSIFLGGTLLFYLSVNNFNYTLAIENAANYFSNQRYHRAYDEIKGVEVKDKDQELKDRIYTVMYVERLYESYEHNMQLGFKEKALDSLLRGVSKYYEHYEEAVELNIVDDIEYSFAQIQTALLENYGITLEQALEINALEDYEYVKQIESYVALNTSMFPPEESDKPQEDTSSPDGEDVSNDNVAGTGSE